MKLTYLGTAAAEGFPALFCRCKYCLEARRLGGKNIRTRSQTLINDDLLIDFPGDTYHHFLQNGIEGDKIKYLLITHPHHDHFYPDDLSMRFGAYAHEMRAPVLQMFCTRVAYEKLGKVPPNVEATVIEPYVPFTLENYRITALPARHMPGGEPVIYIIEDGDKTLLYAHDTGYFFDEVFDYIQSNHIHFDMVSMDCTNVDIPVPNEGGHMGIPNIDQALKRLSEMGAVTEKTIKYVNHFSHNANPLHHVLTERAASIDCLVSYDGCQVEIL